MRISRANRRASSKVANLPERPPWPTNTRGAVSLACRKRYVLRYCCWVFPSLKDSVASAERSTRCLDPETPLVFARPLVRVSVADSTPGLAVDRGDGRWGQEAVHDKSPLM